MQQLERRLRGPAWRKGKMEAAWSYTAAPADPRVLGEPVSRARWFSATLGHALRSLEGVAELGHVEITTAALGEDAFTAHLSEPGALDRLVEYLAACLDFCALRLVVAPRCVDPDGSEFLLADGLYLAVSVDEDDDNAPLLGPDHPFHLSLFMNSTVFVEATFDGTGDNRAFARANRPRLRAVLERLEQTPGVTAENRESSSFAGQLRAHGFADLREDFRAYHVTEGGETVHAVEHTADGKVVVVAKKLEVTDGVLSVDYEPGAPALDTPAMRLLILEHLVPEIAERQPTRTLKSVRFNELGTGHVAELPYRA